MQKRDHRYLAVLSIALTLTLLGIIRDIGSPERLEKQLFSLSVNSNKLSLGSVSYTTTEHHHVEIPAELTPFFFLPVPINRADKELLTTLQAIGPGMAERIIRYRTKYGPIRSENDFVKIPGVGAKRMALLTKSVSYE